MTDNINHPQHYEKNGVRLEPIDFCELFPFCQGNALKYILCRKDKGNELEDLKKARFYLKRAKTNRVKMTLDETQLFLIRYLARRDDPLVKPFKDLWYKGLPMSHDTQSVTDVFDNVQNAVEAEIARLEKENGNT